MLSPQAREAADVQSGAKGLPQWEGRAAFERGPSPFSGALMGAADLDSRYA
jgi:hypothetical protein